MAPKLTLAERALSFISRFKSAQEVGRSMSVLVRPKFAGFYSSKDITFQRATDDGYKALVWVYRCIQAYSTAVSSAPWIVVDVNGKVPKVLKNHPLQRLINNPNKFFGRKEFFDAWTAHLFLAGRAYFEKVYDLKQEKPIALWNMRPDWVTAVPDPLLFISAYEFKPPSVSKPQTYKPDELVEFKFVDPTDPYGCMSPLTAASRTIETENSAIIWNKSMLDNAAVPGGVFNIPAVNTTKPQRDELRLALEQEYSGENRFQTMILWGGMKWEQMGLGPADMQFLEQRRLNKYEICSVFGVPPQMVGAQEDPTYSNYAVARLAFWEDQVVPLLEWLKHKINQSIAPAFGAGIEAQYDLTQVPAMREAFTQKIQDATKLWTMKWPINDINRRLGLGMENVPWGDMAYEQLNQIPIEDLGKDLAPIDTTPQDPNADPNSPPAKPDPKKPAAEPAKPKPTAKPPKKFSRYSQVANYEVEE